MSISGIQADVESERRLRAPSGQQASLEDSLAELVRLADSSGLLRTRSSTSHAASARGQHAEYETSDSGIQAGAKNERPLRAPGQQASLEDSLAELVRLADSSGLLRTRSSSHAVSAHGQHAEYETSVSGIQAGAKNERPLRAPGQQASLEDSLAGLARVADSSGFLRTRSSSTSQTVSMPGKSDPGPTPQPSIDVAPDEPTGTASFDVESWLASKIGKAYLPGGWTLKILALEFVSGVVLVAAAFGLRGGAPGQMKAPPPVAAAEGTTTAAQRSDETVATLSELPRTRRTRLGSRSPSRVSLRSGSRSILAMTPRSVTRIRWQTWLQHHQARRSRQLDCQSRRRSKRRQ
jgi:hypothetical protein